MDQKNQFLMSKVLLLQIPIRWRIEALREIALENGSITSPRIDLYPNCCYISLDISFANDNNNYRSVKISKGNYQKEHMKTNHQVFSHQARFYILDSSGQKRHEKVWILDSRDDSSFIREVDYPQSLNNGCLDIRLDLELKRVVSYRQPDVQPKPVEKLVEKPVNNISTYLERLLDTGLHSDFQIEANGEIIKVHKNVLAIRSQYFSNMFDAGMKESKENALKLADVDSDAIKKLIRYIYIDKLEFTNDPVEDKRLATEILKLADQYQLNELKQLCERELIKKISTENIVEMLRTAHTYNANQLRQGTIEFIKLNKSKLNPKDDFDELVKDLPKLAAEILDLFFKLKL